MPSLQVAYVWHASKFNREVLNGLLRIGFEHHQQIIWDKGRTALTRTLYWFQHEPCWFVRKKNAPWFGKAGENSTIWASPSPKFIMGGSDEEKFDHPSPPCLGGHDEVSRHRLRARVEWHGAEPCSTSAPPDDTCVWYSEGRMGCSCGDQKTTVEDANGFVCAGGAFTVDLGSRLIPGYRCSYSAIHYDNALFDTFGIAFPPLLANAVPKRRSDYLAGRICAERLLTSLGVGAAARDVRIGRYREPVWPEGVVASIAHSSRLAACIGTTDPDVGGVGIDLEQEMPIGVANDIRNQIVDAQEDVVIRKNFDSYSQGLTVVFSAKETIYKAVHRFVERFLEFTAVKLLEVERNSMLFSVREPLADNLCAGSTITVYYSIDVKSIETAACLRRHGGGRQTW